MLTSGFVVLLYDDVYLKGTAWLAATNVTDMTTSPIVPNDAIKSLQVLCCVTHHRSPARCGIAPLSPHPTYSISSTHDQLVTHARLPMIHLHTRQHTHDCTLPIID